MELKTFDTILTELCDAFDALITPKSIQRSNTNIIYLVFKAIAKGYEVINNTCVVLSNKFNPVSCTVEDLDSITSLVGTERLLGSASGLHIIVTNNADTATVLRAGMYTYNMNDDVSFTFEVLAGTTIVAGGNATYIAMSNSIGSYAVTAQADISVTSDQTIPQDLSFSCTANSSLLGTSAETDLEFRKRVLEGYENQSTVVELQTALHNLSYLFDAQVKFNNTLDNIVYDGMTIPPFTAVIFYSGSPRTEIASVIARYLICPTLALSGAVDVVYSSPVFVGGGHTYHINPFQNTTFSINVQYRLDSIYLSSYTMEESIRSALNLRYLSEVHEDFIREGDVYDVVTALNLTGFTLLNVDLLQDGVAVSYIEVPISRIPKLVAVTFTEET